MPGELVPAAPAPAVLEGVVEDARTKELFVGGPLDGRLMNVTSYTHVVETFSADSWTIISYRRRRMAITSDAEPPFGDRDVWERPFWAPTDMDDDEAVAELRSYLTVQWTCQGTRRRITRV